MIPSDMTPPVPVTAGAWQSELKAEYQRGLQAGRLSAIEDMLQAMKCQSKKHPPECGCTDEIEWLRKRMEK